MNCKEKDLAFIKKSLRPKNIGLVISCEKYLGYYLQGDYVDVNGEHWMAIISDNYWQVESSSGSIETMFGKSKVAYMPDTWLSPIKAEPDEDDIDVFTTLDDEMKV